MFCGSMEGVRAGRMKAARVFSKTPLCAKFRDKNGSVTKARACRKGFFLAKKGD